MSAGSSNSWLLVAVYGFVLWLWSHACLSLYLAWALLPANLLDTLGLDFLPQKYW